jgi:DNA repair protein RadC
MAKEEKKEKQKRARLMEKAKGLTDSELLSVIANRAQANAKAKAKAKAAAA